MQITENPFIGVQNGVKYPPIALLWWDLVPKIYCSTHLKIYYLEVLKKNCDKKIRDNSFFFKKNFSLNKLKFAEYEQEAEAEAEGKLKLSSGSKMEAEAKQKPFPSTLLLKSY